MDNTYAGFGSRARVRAVHLYRDTAKCQKDFKTAGKEWWPKLGRVLREHQVDILCGDFNMALTQT
eukprot:4377264-Pyramimonas_sp.AAC.1